MFEWKVLFEPAGRDKPSYWMCSGPVTIFVHRCNLRDLISYMSLAKSRLKLDFFVPFILKPNLQYNILVFQFVLLKDLKIL